MKCRNFFLGAVVGLCFVAASSTPALASAPHPEVAGNRIMDSVTGEEFVPRGVNWPSFEYACQQGWGYSNEGGTSDTSLLTALAMASWNINTVRIPLNQDCWLGDDGLPITNETSAGHGSLFSADGYRDAIIDFVKVLNGQGIVTILDLHWTGPDGVVADGLRSMADDRSDDFWTSVASRFKEDESVIFDAFNEPHSRWLQDSLDFDLTWDIWENGAGSAPVENDEFKGDYSGVRYSTTGMSDLVEAVRAAGATQPIILSGLNYANDLTGWLTHKPADGQLIAGFHTYPGNACSDPACWSSEILPVALELPVITTEFGQDYCDVGSTSLMNSYMRWADNRSIGYLAWAWWRPDDPELVDCKDWALVDDLAGSPRSPVGTAYRDHLISMNEPPITGTPTDPGAGPDPAKPDPVGSGKRSKAKLRILAPKFRRGKLSFKVKAAPGVTGKVKVRVYVKGRKGKKASIKTKGKLKASTARFSFTVRGDFKPTRIVARFAGNQKFKPDRTWHRVGS